MSAPVVVVNSSASVGGAELSMLPVVARLAREREVVAFLPGEGPLEDRLTTLGIETRPEFHLDEVLGRASGSLGRAPGVGLVRAGLGQQLRLQRALWRLRPSVVYCNGFRAQVGATLPARLAGASVVWHVRDFSRGGPLGAAWRSLAAATGLILANSAATGAQPSLRHALDRVKVAMNGVDLELFASREAEPPWPPVIGMAAHLTPWKGHRTFVRLLRTARRDIPALSGRIAGQPLYETEGNRGYAEALEREIAAQGLRDACSLEPVEPEAMPAFYSSLHCLVHAPDRAEPFGRVLAEAQAVGVPIVAFDRGAIRDVAGPAAAIVEPGDEAALRRELVALLVDEPRRQAMSRAGLRRALELFDEDRYADAVAADVLALA